MKMEQLIEVVKTLQTKVEALEKSVAEATKPRDRGPKSEQTMTEAHAFSVKFGEHAKTKHKDAAEALGLSYGQIFSCRGGYTFKQVTKDWKPKAAESVAPVETPAETPVTQ